MYKRHLEEVLRKSAEKYHVLVILGPRQSGKTTLASSLFKTHTYILFEEPDQRRFAMEDPRGFFKRHRESVILDEVQHVPELLSYIQGIVDQPNNRQQFVLTGSQHLLLMERISQTLAGRGRIVHLLPFTLRELRYEASAEISISQPSIPRLPKFLSDLETMLYTGGYPRIYDKKLNPTEWYSQYYQTYVEKDVRSILNLTNIDLFDRFIRLCAGRVGQLLNLASLGGDTGISQPTANAWLTILQAGFICFKLQPHFRNFHKRLIKTPKLYFFDTGLLCYLLRITDPQQIYEHPLRGAIFENWVISEFSKSYFHRGLEPPLYFWRDQKGHEVDLIVDQGTTLFPIEIKSARTFHPDFLRDSRYLNSLQKNKHVPQGCVIYAGEENSIFQNHQILSWQAL